MLCHGSVENFSGYVVDNASVNSLENLSNNFMEHNDIMYDAEKTSETSEKTSSHQMMYGDVNHVD